MRWGDLDVAFGRPVHWLVALHGEQAVPFEFAGIESGRQTRGHRFLAPEPVELPAADQYTELLREVHVVVDGEQRRRIMADALHRAAEHVGGALVEDEFLMQECVSLVEEPHVVPGSFDEAFLALPESVVVSVMRDHQRYFAVRDPERGQLLPRYLNVVNTAQDPDTIARGNDRVLRARLADAQFFVDEDRKRGLEAYAGELDRVVFQAKLGSLGDKVRRIAQLATRMAGPVGAEPARVERAAHLCKADLVSHIVGEFPELEGEMGRWYALHEGVDQSVADAIRDHHLPAGAGDPVPSDVHGAVLAVADRVDTLIGCFGVGLIPSGSADPFALRRAALGVLRIALEGPTDIELAPFLSEAMRIYEQQDQALAEGTRAKVDEFFRGRLKAYYADAFPSDLVDACLAAWGRTDGSADRASVRDFDARVRALDAFRRRPEFESLAVAFKRTFNIAGNAPDGMWDNRRLEQEAERMLADRFAKAQERIGGAVARGAYEQALGTVAEELREPVDRFFDEVFVMVEDPETRDNRLRLLGRIADTLKGIAHFHLLST
jgi:glycyl-tRNA synthetase beta chain